MNLKVLERIQLLGVLPTESDFSTLKIVRSLQNDLSFSEEEIKETGLTLKDNQYRWKKEVEKDVQIGDKGNDIIKNSFKKLNEQKKVPMSMFNLYEKFIKDSE